MPSISSTDYDTLMRANAVRVFSERDPAKRLEALSEIWAPDGTLFELETVSGYEAISESVGALLRQLPPDTVFTPAAPAMGHHGLGLLRWAAGVRGAAPGPVTGTDVAIIKEGRIQALYVFLDPSA
jgi:hypothetical protein